MDRIRKLIEEHGLREDAEHIIIALRAADGSPRTIHILRRPYLIIRKDAEHATTAALEDIVEAVLRNPDGSLWDELRLGEKEHLLPDDEGEAEEEEERGQDEASVGIVAPSASGTGPEQ